MTTESLSDAELAALTDAYMECALWASTDENGEPLDGEPLAPETEQTMRDDCLSFCEAYVADLRAALALPGYSTARAGHDLWLTRNRHGAGYWDRGLGAVGDALAKAARAEGSRDLYRGDDGLIYQYGG